MRKTISILLIIMITITITGCTTSKKQTDSEKFKEEYEKENGKKSKSGNVNRTVSISEDNPFVYSTAEEISEKIDNKETFIVYFGFSTCPWCRSIIEELIRCAKDSNVDKIYYVDVLDIRDKKEINDAGEIETTKKGTKGYMKLIEKMSDVLSEYTTTDENDEEVLLGEKRIYAPNYFYIENGKVKKMIEGISESQKDPYEELTDEILDDEEEQFEDFFKSDSTCKVGGC